MKNITCKAKDSLLIHLKGLNIKVYIFEGKSIPHPIQFCKGEENISHPIFDVVIFFVIFCKPNLILVIFAEKTRTEPGQPLLSCMITN